MITSIPRMTSIEMLLNTLEAERYVRGPLLLSLLDELSAAEGLAPAADVARAMLQRIEAGDVSEPELAREIARLRARIRALTEAAGLARRAPSGSGAVNAA
jgi:hypothetical protein